MNAEQRDCRTPQTVSLFVSEFAQSFASYEQRTSVCESVNGFGF